MTVEVTTTTTTTTTTMMTMTDNSNVQQQESRIFHDRALFRAGTTLTAARMRCRHQNESTYPWNERKAVEQVREVPLMMVVWSADRSGRWSVSRSVGSVGGWPLFGVGWCDARVTHHVTARHHSAATSLGRHALPSCTHARTHARSPYNRRTDKHTHTCGCCATRRSTSARQQPMCNNVRTPRLSEVPSFSDSFCIRLGR